MPKQTTTVIQGGRAGRPYIRQPPMGGKSRSATTTTADRSNGSWTRGANPYWVAVKEQTRAAREGPNAAGGFSGGRGSGCLLLGGGSAGFGALDSLFFSGATAPDVGLHRRYNPTGRVDLQ